MAKRRTLSSIMGEDLAISTELLNSASRDGRLNMRKSRYISFEDIIENEKNQMSMTDIDKLANLIEISGLEQPLVVRQREEDGKYVILTGHRRYAAIRLLIERGKWNDDHLIEVKVKDLDEWDIPLEPEDKEMLSILTTNQCRIKTDADIAFEVKHWNDIISKLRSKGIEVLDIGFDDEGNPIGRNIHGERTKDIVADQVGISAAQVAKYNKVAKDGSEKLKEALQKNKIPVAVASTVAARPKAEQDAILDAVENKTSITKADVQKAVKEITAGSGMQDVKTVPITKDQLQEDLAHVFASLEDKEVRLASAEYNKYVKLIRELVSLFH